jgi:hypothetical protein
MALTTHAQHHQCHNAPNDAPRPDTTNRCPKGHKNAPNDARTLQTAQEHSERCRNAPNNAGTPQTTEERPELQKTAPNGSQPTRMGCQDTGEAPTPQTARRCPGRRGSAQNGSPTTHDIAHEIRTARSGSVAGNGQKGFHEVRPHLPFPHFSLWPGQVTNPVNSLPTLQTATKARNDARIAQEGSKWRANTRNNT